MQVHPAPRRSPLVEVIDAVTPLSVFDGLFRGRCVFHGDPDRGLYVDARGAFFHCFACGAHGDEGRWRELLARRTG